MQQNEQKKFINHQDNSRMAFRYYNETIRFSCAMLELTDIQRKTKQKTKTTSKVPEYLLVVQLWKIININVSEMTTNFTLKKKN